LTDKLTPHEQEFRDGWRGQYDVITSVDEFIEMAVVSE
jgi:hypothetical protein